MYNSNKIHPVLSNKNNVMRLYGLDLNIFVDLADCKLEYDLNFHNIIYFSKRIYDGEPILFDDNESRSFPIGQVRHLLSLGVSVGFLFSFPKIVSLDITPAYIAAIRKQSLKYGGLKNLMSNSDIEVFASGASSLLVLNKRSGVLSWQV